MSGNATAASSKLCVIFHLYYQDMWDDFYEYLLNLSEVERYDLFITLNKDNPLFKLYVNKFIFKRKAI